MFCVNSQCFWTSKSRNIPNIVVVFLYYCSFVWICAIEWVFKGSVLRLGHDQWGAADPHVSGETLSTFINFRKRWFNPCKLERRQTSLLYKYFYLSMTYYSLIQFSKCTYQFDLSRFLRSWHFYFWKLSNFSINLSIVDMLFYFSFSPIFLKILIWWNRFSVMKPKQTGNFDLFLLGNEIYIQRADGWTLMSFHILEIISWSVTQE